MQASPELDKALSELEDRGLIGWDRGANRYDAHPIVRGVVWQLTAAKDQQAVYEALHAHFEPMATPQWEEVESLADLTPAIERYNTLVGLGRYDDAFALFGDRLDRATLYRLSVHRERIALLERIFPQGTAAQPALTREGDQASALGALAVSYRLSGQPGQAASLYWRDEEICKRLSDEHNRQIVLSNLGLALRNSGALREADWTYRTALVLNRKRTDRFHEGISLLNLG